MAISSPASADKELFNFSSCLWKKWRAPKRAGKEMQLAKSADLARGRVRAAHCVRWASRKRRHAAYCPRRFCFRMLSLRSWLELCLSRPHKIYKTRDWFFLWGSLYQNLENIFRIEEKVDVWLITVNFPEFMVKKHNFLNTCFVFLNSVYNIM